ncbi:MAG: SO_0444 family Cu/Zn efflux transporter [Planctomycetota bacterium]
MDFTPLQTALLLFAVSLAGALLPLLRRWSERGLHMFVSISAGVFLGTVFLHLLPHLAGVDPDGHAHHAEAEGAGPSLAPWIAALFGLLLLFSLEKVWLRSVSEGAAQDPHRALWAATWLGLGMHSISEGMALAAILEDPAVRTQLLVSILAHKATEAFSLATVMRLAHLGNARSVTFLALFALLGPLGILIGSELASEGGVLGQVLTGFACGTFLYVALCDLLPEVFHGVERAWIKLGAVALGVLATAVTLPRLAWAVEFGGRVFQESLSIFLELSPFLLLGFLIAGVLHQVLKPSWMTRHVAGESMKSVAVASLIGAPLPLCSCSVLPVAVSMRKHGASKGATSSFLIATPETGVDSIAVSWGLLGPFLTVARFLGAILSAIFVGGAVSWFVRMGFDRPESAAKPRAAAAVDACAHAVTPEPPRAVRTTASHAHSLRERSFVQRVLHYAFVEMMDDLAASLIVGILLSGVIAAAIPPEVFESPIARGFPGMLLMLAFGIPIYVCAAASTPIAATLLLKGMSPGAAFVFLLASPATNLGSLAVLSRHLGKRVVLVQVAALSIVTLALGWIVDLLWRAFGLEVRATPAPEASHAVGWIAIAAAALLGAFLVVSLVRTRGLASPFGRSPDEPQPVAR